MKKQGMKMLVCMLFLVTMLISVAGVSAHAEAALNKKSMVLLEGQNSQLKVTDAKGKVTWKSSRKSVASVSKSGKVTAKKSGVAVITAKCNGKTLQCKVTVPKPLLSKTSISLQVGSQMKLNVLQTKKKAKWSSAKKAIATVNGSGVVTAKKVGTTKVYAKVNGKKYTCTVNVKAKATVQPAAPVKVDYYDKLQTYIINYGGTNTNGDKFIKDSIYDQGANYTYAVIYDRAADQLEFLLISEDEIKSSVSMTLKKVNNSVKVEFLVIYEEYKSAGSAKGTFNAAAYDGKKTMSYATETTGYITSAQVNQLANAFLKLGFTAWDNLIYSKLGFGMKEIGFVNYNL